MCTIWNIPPHIWRTLIFSIVIPIVCGVTGGAVPALLAHKFAKERESVARQFAAALSRENRKRDFLRFLAEWKGKIKTDHPHNFIALRDAMNPKLEVEAGLIRGDLPESLQTEFDRLVATLASLTNRQLTHGHQNLSPQEIWLAELDPLISFMNRN
jgi:hypothetical protein